MQAFALFIQS